MTTIHSNRGGSLARFPIVLRVEVPTLAPAPVKAGDHVVIHADRVDIVRGATNDPSAWVAQWLRGSLSPMSEHDTAQMFELARDVRNNLTNPQPVAKSTARAPRLVLERTALDEKGGAQ